MANIYKQADQRRRVAPGSKRGEAPAAKEETVVVPTPVEETEVKVAEEVKENREEVVEVKEAPAAEPAKETVEAPVEKEKPAPAPKKPKKEAEKVAVGFDFPIKVKGKKKNYSLYLSEANMEELQKRSKQYGMSVSEYLDEILKKVFEA